MANSNEIHIHCWQRATLMFAIKFLNSFLHRVLVWFNSILDAMCRERLNAKVHKMTASVQWTYRFIDDLLKITQNMTHIAFSCIVKVFRIFVNLSNEWQPFSLEKQPSTIRNSATFFFSFAFFVVLFYRHPRWLKYMGFDYMIAVRANPIHFTI